MITVKAHGLCFYCGDKFDAGHIDKCTKRPKAHVNALVANDLDHNLTDEILDQLAVEDSLNEEFCQLSLNALAGTDCDSHENCNPCQKQGHAHLGGLILVDSGSSHSFVSSAFIQTVGQPNRLSWLMEPP